MNFIDNYDSITDQINSIVSTQITQSMWNSIPGGLDKVSTSSMGFAWGIGGGDVFVCQLPCNGQWKKVDSGAIDIITDDNYVYVLTSTSLKIKSASNVDDWVIIKTPGLSSIISTNSYIWGQANGKTYKLAKPCTTGNWILVTNTTNITSGSSTSLYGVDDKGNAVKTDEALQSGWNVIPDFIGSNISKVIGDLDQTALYGLDTTNQLKRCVMGKCYNVHTDYTPKNVTADPTTKTIWMTTQTSGDKGNIFTKLDSSSDTIPAIQPLDKQRDDVIKESKSSFNESTHTGIMNRQIKIVLEYISKFFKIKKDPNSDKNLKKLNEDVERLHADAQQLQVSIPVLQRIVLYVLAAASMYLVSSFIGWLSHILAFGILVYGIYDVYFLQPKL
jgi:hypothetical protein